MLKSRTEETKRNTGRGLLSTAKSASGVASPLYSIPTTKTDRESSRRLLEMFDRKKNWLFHGMEGSDQDDFCLLYTSPSPRDATLSRMPSSA